MTSKIKIVGLFLGVVVVSASTSAAMHFLLFQSSSGGLNAQSAEGALTGFSTSLQNATPVLIDCDDGVYSPVQNKCVSQDIFDQEMMRLYSALGIDVSILQLNGGKNESEKNDW